MSDGVSAAGGRSWEPSNPEYERVVADAFRAQRAMELIGARLEKIEPGFVEIRLPCHEMVMSQYPGVVHGGTVGMIADSALGFAALTLAPPDGAGVTAEYKINMLRPAGGETLVARGSVLRSGQRITVAEAQISSLANGSETLVAIALGTLVPV